MQSILNEENIFDIMNNMLSAAQKVSKDSLKKNSANNSKYYLGGSISRYSKGLVMSFPILCDDTLSLETAQLISKANEKNIATMLEMLFASMSLNGKEGETGKDFIRKFHKNIDTMSMDDIIDATNDVVNSQVAESGYLKDLSRSEINECISEMCDILKMPAKSFPINSFSESSLNTYLVRETYGKTVVFEDREALDREKFEYQQDKDKEKAELDRKNRLEDRADQAASKNRDRMDKFNADNTSMNQRRILDSDFKKANELQPTVLIINFNTVNEKGVIDRKSFVAGVKCRLIASESTDIVERLSAANKTSLSFKNLIRATTGEINFVRDFILAVNQQKIDAKNDVKKGEAAKVWATLKKRSVSNNARKLSRDKNDASAITTLVVSQDTVNYIKAANNGFDISIAKNAVKIMDNFNLLCLVVADEANEVAKFLYDGNSEFEMVSYRALDKNDKDKEMRQAVNLLLKGR